MNPNKDEANTQVCRQEMKGVALNAALSIESGLFMNF